MALVLQAIIISKSLPFVILQALGVTGFSPPYSHPKDKKRTGNKEIKLSYYAVGFSTVITIIITAVHWFVSHGDDPGTFTAVFWKCCLL